MRTFWSSLAFGSLRETCGSGLRSPSIRCAKLVLLVLAKLAA